jgi:hypothetical protein
MEKPIVFFSHSSKDEKSLRALRHLIEEKTGGAIIIFLSSDGQSIPFGRNWVHKVEEALSNSSLMFVFVSPNSLSSNWIYFETGYAYSRGIKVVPVGFGVDLNEINPPLSLLQGFNLDKVDALGNIVASINETYETKFNSVFSQKEFYKILSNENIQMGIPSVRQIVTAFHCSQIVTPLSTISDLLTSRNVEHVVSGDFIWSNGIQVYKDQGDMVVVTIDGLLAGVHMPILVDLYENDQFILADTGEIFFEPDYVLVSEDFVRLTALIRDTNIAIETGRNMRYKDISFRLVDIGRGWSSVRLDIFFKDHLFTLDWLKELCSMFLEKKVIIIGEARLKLHRVGLTND